MADTELLCKNAEKYKLTLTLTEDRLKLFLALIPSELFLKELQEYQEAEELKSKSKLKSKGKSASSQSGPKPKDRPEIRRSEIMEIIKGAVSMERVDRGVINDCVKRLNAGETLTDRRIAAGVPPSAGIDGKLVLMVKIHDGKFALDADGKGMVDLRDIHLFDNVVKDQEVARIYSPKLGKPGVDALAQPIAALMGKEITIEYAEGLTMQEVKREELTFKSLRTSIEGFVTIENQKYTVKDELHVKQNLDYHTGNINFIGKVRISGDVMPGFRIKATKNIEVTGAVQAATIISSGGDVTIKGNAFGSPNTYVIAGQTLNLFIAQELRAAAKQNITVSKEARDCMLKAGGAFLADTGRITGGKLFTPCGVSAKALGNKVGELTEIELCTDVETTSEYGKVSAEIKAHENAAKLLELHLGPFAKHPARIELLPLEQKFKMELLVQKLESVRRSYETLLGKRSALLSGGKSSRIPRVNYQASLHHGTRVTAGETAFDTVEDLKGPGTLEFDKAQQKFVVKGLEPLDLDLQGEIAKAL